MIVVLLEHSDLIQCGDMPNNKLLVSHLLTNKVDINFHVFCSGMEIGLTVRKVADKLSHYSIGGERKSIRNSPNNCCTP